MDERVLKIMWLMIGAMAGCCEQGNELWFLQNLEILLIAEW